MIKLRELVSAVFLTTTLLLSPQKAEPTQTPDRRQQYLKELIYNPFDNVVLPYQTEKLILKRSDTSEEDSLFAGHRSHRSHSSHRSHYSSRTNTPDQSTTTTPTTTTTIPTTSIYPGTRPSTSKSTSSPLQKPTQETGVNQLGSRLLSKGMSGPDVLELKKSLTSKGYSLPVNNTFDDLTEATLKDFQSKKGIPFDGKAGPLTIYHLKNK